MPMQWVEVVLFVRNCFGGAGRSFGGVFSRRTNFRYGFLWGFYLSVEPEQLKIDRGRKMFRYICVVRFHYMFPLRSVIKETIKRYHTGHSS